MPFSSFCCLGRRMGLPSLSDLMTPFFVEDGFGDDLAVLVALPDRDERAFFVALVIQRLEADGAADDLPGRPLQKAHDGHGGDGLAAAGLADDADGGVHGHFKADAVDRLDDALIGKEEGVQILYFEDIALILHLRDVCGRRELAALCLFEAAHLLVVRLRDRAGLFARQVMFGGGGARFALLFFLKPFQKIHAYRLCLGSRASRSPSPIKLKPRTAMTIQTPEGTQTQG